MTAALQGKRAISGPWGTRRFLLLTPAGAMLSAWWVPSALNLADAPTRRAAKSAAMQKLHDEGFQEVSWEWPRDAPW